MSNHLHQHAVLGAGTHMTKAHLAFLKPPRVSRLDLFDPGADLSALSKQLKTEATLHPTQAEALATRAGAVWIGSPDQFHMDQLEKALAAGKHVFVEKPLATKEEELPRLNELLELAEKRSLIVLSCHPRRFDPPFLWIKERLPSFEARFGKPIAFEFDFTYHVPVASWKLSRSLLLDHGPHEIDLLNFLLGGEECTARRLNDSATRYHVTGSRKDGLVFSFSGTRTLTNPVYDEVLRLRFERGEVTLHATRGKVAVYDHELRKEKRSAVPPTQYKVRNRGVTENFIHSIAGETSPYLTKSEILTNTEFAVRLAETGVL